ncbi:hypothetical protein KEM55_008151 [Ascosphaera atra]|nr:hypothetical protein KEM55_008151 [Ascosphaera atra]
MNMPVTGIPPPPYHGSMNTNPAEMVTGHPPPPLYRSVAGALPSRPPVSMATDFSDVSTARVQPPPYVVPQITPIPGVTPTQPPEGLITIPPGLTPAGLQTPTYRPQAAPAPRAASSLTSHMASQLAPGEAPRVLSDDYDIVLVPKRRGQAPGSSQGNQEVYGPTYEASPLALPPHAPANLPAPMTPRHGYPPFTQQTSLANPSAPAMMQQGYPPVTQQPALTPQPLPPGHGGDLGLPMQPTAGGPMYPYPEPSQAEQGPPPVAPPAPPQAPETPYTLTESSSETGQKSG